MRKHQQLVVILSLGLSLIGCGGVSTEDPASLPVAVNDDVTVSENSSSIFIPVLTNDSGTLDVTTVDILTPPQSNDYEIIADGTVRYRPVTGFNGTDSFVYTVQDTNGNFSNPATVAITVTAQVIITVTRRDPHTHVNCLGGIDKSGDDINGNGILDDNEVTSENPIYDEGTPVTRTELDTLIANNDDVTNINTCEIEDMSLLFHDKTTFNQDISGWNVGSVNNMTGMFHSASAFNGNISSWKVGSVINMSGMFRDASAFNGNISNWDVGSVKKMNYMFFGAEKFNGINIGLWSNKVANVEDMSYMFHGALLFNEDIGDWNVISVKFMNYMFFNAKTFQGLNLGSWGDKVKNVENMNYMFSGTTVFNGDISSWNVSSVKNMSSMFNGAIAFNGDISNWDVNSVEQTKLMFISAKKFEGIGIGKWGNKTKNITSMNQMFSNAISFNADIGNWNVSSVITMNSMFKNANSFDQDIGGWDVSLVGDMTDMFLGGQLSTTNYDNLLNGWFSLPSLKNDVVFSAGKTKYSELLEETRGLIILNYNWTITDGGVAP